MRSGLPEGQEGRRSDPDQPSRLRFLNSTSQVPDGPLIQSAQLNGSRQVNARRFDLGADMPAKFASDEPAFSMGELLQVVWRRLWVIVLVATVLTGVVVGASLIQTPTYAASIKILVGQEPADNANTSLGADVSGLQQITQTMAQAVDTRPVMEEVIGRLELQESPDQLLANTSAEQIGATTFIEVSYVGTDPQVAQQVANTIGDVFSEQVSEVGASANAITATMWERATTPYSPVSPDPLRNGLIGLAFGTLLGIGLAFLIERLDDRWRSPEEVERISGVPTFGAIPTIKVRKSKKTREDN